MELATYRKQFIKAARVRIGELERQLGEIRNDLTNHTVLNEMHISAHSLKGEAYAVGYQHIAELAFVIEKYLKQLIEKRKDFPIEKFPAFSYAIAMVSSAITRLEHENQEPELQDVVKTAREQLGIIE